ncbi:protein of unknown function [Nitrosomonas cryotolerans]|uniref:IrrE N-terminal-like domain-containing protein n=1 Tax=Nitrosomonas cryotolerans ATCC 49181 TaxID=1131553 RepID=A0A1N6G244_9PROT|nr:ImmA/IrrE family metallo-endopeptidase [Nitrosomonas cryotolerans]SFQ08010.1 protein of unknown function [Nitrosomonas cryotolerans]SIO01560.1 protein of unknown function [Nitrosomonas cryotolerans ATCC 49181]
MTPVEKMAKRLLDRHNLKPPYDLETLVEIYASVEYFHFPFEADGITIGIGGESKPQVLINTSPPETRRKFTLAHELGHIIIPWHTGTIVSHSFNADANVEYKEMEIEANLFAAELLIPSGWLQELQQSFSSVELFIKAVLVDTGASRDAVLIQAFKTINIPIVCAQVDSNGYLIRDYCTKIAPSPVLLNGRNLLEDKIFSMAYLEEDFILGDRYYKSWTFDDKGIEEVDRREWRDILNQILDETESRHLLQSINAVLASKYNSNKDHLSEKELCSLAMRAYDGKGKFDKIVVHPLFPQYIVKRIKELIAKYKRKGAGLTESR